MAEASREAERFGRYEIVRRIASGGMGEVYLAKSLGAAGFQKHVVIKKILPHLVEHPQTVRSLVREAKLLVLLNHPNIVQVLDLGVEGTDYFMAMEYVHGYNHSTILHYCSKKKLLIPAPACAFLAIEVLRALGYAHDLRSPDGTRHNIIHRDISPQNVLITYDGRVKLTDFGIAKVLSEAEDELTQSLKGKWRYMAPEAVEGRRIDQRYDLFAVGIVLFESLCRRNLFGGKRDVDILNKVREARVPSVTKYHPDAHPLMVEVTERSLKKDPNERYQRASEFVDALRAAIKPLSDNEAEDQLRAFIADLYERPDFPLNKPKLADPNVLDKDATRSIVIHSRLSAEEQAQQAANAVSATDVAKLPANAPVDGGRSFVIVGVLSVVLLVISGVVALLAYKILFNSPPSGDGRAPVIIVNRKPDASSQNTPNDDDASEQLDGGRAGKPDRGDTSSRGSKHNGQSAAHKPARFTPDVGARVFRRAQPALMACYQQHSAAGDPAVALSVVSTILGSGRVDKVELAPPQLGSTPLGTCVIKAAQNMRYPKHDQPSVVYRQPIRLQRQTE